MRHERLRLGDGRHRAVAFRLVPDRFHGGIIGAFLAALGGAILTGFMLPTPGVPLENPPGVGEALWPVPGALVGLAVSYWYGARRDAARRAGDRPIR
jgi:hypothetical protein